MEDAELLRQLKAVDKRKFNKIINTVFRAYNDYETSVSVYRQARTELLESLD